MPNRPWTRDELLVAINLYCRTPFGKLHHNNPDIVALAVHLHRSPSAVAMKLVNFASIDPSHRARGIKGLRNVSKLDNEVWKEFYSNWEQLAYESQRAFYRLQEKQYGEVIIEDASDVFPTRKTEMECMVRVRLVQSFFRDTILVNYNSRCAFCGLNLPLLLIASHIIPWKDSVEKRADPRNGICLCALHDKAFDKGILSIDVNFGILVSSLAKKKTVSVIHRVGLIDIEGNKITLPRRFMPDLTAIEFHRSQIFKL